MLPNVEVRANILIIRSICAALIFPPFPLCLNPGTTPNARHLGLLTHQRWKANMNSRPSVHVMQAIMTAATQAFGDPEQDWSDVEED